MESLPLRMREKNWKINEGRHSVERLIRWGKWCRLPSGSGRACPGKDENALLFIFCYFRRSKGKKGMKRRGKESSPLLRRVKFGMTEK